MLIKWLVGAISLYIVSYFIKGLYISNFIGAFWASAALGFVNLFVKPILSFFALPITIITLGLFTFVINGVVLLIASFLSSSLYISNFTSAMIGAIFLSIINSIILGIVDGKK